MRQVVLDTETTGLEAARGHRVIEIGCIELVNRRASGRHFHSYLNADEFLRFIADSELIIHNASFDVGFLDAELARLGRDPPVLVGEMCAVLDTLALAREMHPGQRNSLDALSKRYAIDNSQRELHGALLDARILADVYLAMTGGQSALALDEAPRRDSARHVIAAGSAPDLALVVVAATPAERAAHEQLQELLQKESGGRCLWRSP